MSERLQRLPDEELGRALFAVGSRLDVPRVDVARSVATRVETERPRAAVIPFPVPRSRTLRRAVLVAVAAVLLLGAAAVAGRLGVPGLRVVFAPGPTPTNVPVGRNLFLGTPTSLERARGLVQFPVITPHGQGLGPASVYVGQEQPGGRVSLIWPSKPGLPGSKFIRAGALVTEFEGRFDRAYIKKLRFGTGTHIRSVTVNGESALWFSGSPHELEFLDRNGIPFPQSSRLAGNTLVWTKGTVTARLECACGLARALRIAESVR
jgi:hypothetical protein